MMQNQPVQPNIWPQFNEYQGMPQVEHSAQMELLPSKDFHPPPPGWKTSGFWLTILGSIGLGYVAYKGVITAEQAQTVAQALGITLNTSIVGLVAWVLKTYVQQRGQVAITRQHFFGEIKKAEAQNASLPPLDNSALLQQQIDYLQAQLRVAQNRPQ